MIAAGQLGKIKTVSQIALVVWLMLYHQPIMANWFSILLTAWVVVITLWSGADYFIRNASVLRDTN